MSIKFKNKSESAPAPITDNKPEKKASTHAKARPIDGICFDPSKPSRLRTGHLMSIYGVSHSGLYKMMKDGRIPQPDGYYGQKGIGKRPTPFWLTSNPHIQETQGLQGQTA